MKNEKTSARVATVAARLAKITARQLYYAGDQGIEDPKLVKLVREIRLVAASCLTQTADKPKARKIATRKKCAAR